MILNTDYRERVVLDTADLPWMASPSPGVLRRMLERDGGERARATTVVRYQSETGFPAHAHPGGEEIFVLSGTFADEHGVYRAGTYVRNPHGSSHAPRVTEGCELFVKLRHLDPADTERRVIDTGAATWLPGENAGIKVQPLAAFGSEHTALVRFAAGATFPRHPHLGGEEILVLDGELRDEHGVYPVGTWLRNPPQSRHAPYSARGCTLLVKVGHLADRITLPDPARG